LLISHCLCGEPCRYDGLSKGLEADVLSALSARYRLVPVCPEVVGGLPTPRQPAERVGDRVRTQAGADVTAAYEAGAQMALALCREEGCERALLKERSPSCGCGQIYDGTFTATLTQGDGVTADLLLHSGIAVYGESRLDELLK
jgi:uncharacterized protein YbbK (DUF523 family)